MIHEGGKAADFILRRFLSDAPDYPAALQHRFADGQLPVVTSQGRLSVLDSTRIGFFCSVHCPGDVILKTYDLARMLRETNVTIVGGFQSPMEKECLDLLLRGSASVVVSPARGLGRMRIPKGWKEPLAEGRLLILSFFDDSILRPTADLAVKRNAHIAALADRILIAHAEKGGKTEALCKEALIDGKPMFAIDSPDNAHLVKLGVVPVRAEDFAPLVAKK